MANIAVYNQTGSKVKDIALNDYVFGIEPNQQAIFDAVIMQRASMRQGTHDVKNRREVRGGGKKPWRQKGTGRARQGSIRSPQWRGGGIVFGPTPRDYGYRLNRKVRRLAVRSVLSEKLATNELMIVDSLSFQAPKTKDFAAFLDALKIEKRVVVVVADDAENDNVFLSARNLENVLVLTADAINVYDMLASDQLVITEAAVEQIQEVLGNE